MQEKIIFLKKLSRSKELLSDFVKEVLNTNDCEQLYEKYSSKLAINLICPNCGEQLIFMMPDVKSLGYNKCNRYYENNKEINMFSCYYFDKLLIEHDIYNIRYIDTFNIDTLN